MNNCFIEEYSSKNIFILDDEKIICLDLERRLQRNGYRNIFLFNSPEESIAASEKMKPDLVITDDTMYGPMDGPDAVDHFKEHFNIPIIGLGTMPVELWIRISKKHIFDIYLYKPIKEREILDNITLLFIKYYGLQNEKLPFRH